LLLTTDIRGRTVLHEAAFYCETWVLHKLREWATERLTTEEINKKLLFARDSNGVTVWYLAANIWVSDFLQKLWEWAKENLTTEEITNELFLATGTEATITHRQKIVNELHKLAKQGKISL
jgi:hypothetical protein